MRYNIQRINKLKYLEKNMYSCSEGLERIIVVAKVVTNHNVKSNVAVEKMNVLGKQIIWKVVKERV